MVKHAFHLSGLLLLSLSCVISLAQERDRGRSEPKTTRRSASQASSIRRFQSENEEAEEVETSARHGGQVRHTAAVEPVEEPTYDLASLRAIAIERSPSLYEASAHIDSLIGKRTQAGLWSNPDVGFSGQQVGSRGLAEQNGVMIGQKIVTAQKLRFDQSVVSEEIRRAQHRYDAQRLKVETDVTVAFYECLAAQKLLDLANELNRIAVESHKTVEKLKLGSEASRIDVLQAKLEMETSRIKLDNAEHRLEAAWRNLVTIVGERGLPPRRLFGSLENGVVRYSWDEALTKLVDQSPELRAAQATTERARWAHQRAMREIYPNIDASGIVQKDHAISGWDGAIQLSIPVPILNRNQGGIRQALANVAVAEQAYERTRLQLENRLARVFEQYANAMKQSERFEKDLLPDAKEQLDLTQKVFVNGEVAYIIFLTAQRSFSQVNTSAVEAQRELATASSRIEGLLLEGSLEDQNLAP